MANLDGHSRAQTKFLRACQKDPCGLPRDQWPNATTFRRWMRRPTFRRAVKGIREALRFQADLQLTAAAAVAARALNSTVAHPPADEDGAALAEPQRDPLRDMVSVLKLVHARERFSIPREQPEPEPEPAQRPPTPQQLMLKYLRDRPQVFRPHTTVGELLKHLETLDQMARRADGADGAERRPAA